MKVTVFADEDREHELGDYNSVTLTPGGYSALDIAIARDEDGRTIAALHTNGWWLPDGSIWSDIVISGPE